MVQETPGSEVPRPEAVARPLAAGLTILAGLLRLVPHPWNFTPVGALGLFGGGRLRSWHAYALPIGLMLLSDAALAALHGPQYFFNGTLPFIYVSFLLYVWIGRRLRQTSSPWSIGCA